MPGPECLWGLTLDRLVYRIAAMETPPTRDRLLSAMADALQRRGLHGVGLNEILRDAQAPKGVLYHHFPGGKTALAVAAISAITERITGSLEQALGQGPDPVAALERWVGGAMQHLAGSGFQRGCPLATVALESTPEDVEIRQALAAAFTAIRLRMASALQTLGLPAPHAEGLAALLLAAYEGGLLQARVAGSAVPMAQTTQTLLALLRASLPRRETP